MLQRVAAAVAAVATVPLVATACAKSEPVGPAPTPKPDASASTTHAVPTPPPMTQATTPPATQPPPTTTHPPPPPSHPFTRTPHVLFLDYDGGTFSNCSNQCERPAQNESFIIGTGFGLSHYDFAAYPAADRPTVTAEVTKLMSPWNVQVVTARPSSGPYDEAIVSPSDPPNAPHGISYVDCRDQRHNETMFILRTGDAYTQEDLLGNGVSGPKKVGVEVVHEFGHTLGLDHQAGPAVMNETSNAETFPDAAKVSDGTGYSCASGSSYDSSAVLDQVLGRRG